MKIAYFDCFSGISGDMCLGALVDSGMPVKDIEKGLRRIPLRGFRLEEKKVKRAGIAATKVNVLLVSERGRRGTEARRWRDIQGIIKSSSLPDGLKKMGYRIFRDLFEAEAKVHGSVISRVHLHELGAVDCLVDVFGTLIGLELLGVQAVYSSPVNLGSGTVMTGHGILPVPAPATAVLVKDMQVYSSGASFEMTTPTGAAILKTLVQGFGEMPVLIPERTGTGAGSKDVADRPNVLRIFVGDIPREEPGDRVTVIETNIDDMNPQIYEYLIERLFEAGALDVFLTQGIMKKMRPGIKVSVLCHKAERDKLAEIILRETTSIGVRSYEASRVVMDRDTAHVSSQHGRARVKLSRFGGSVVKVMPEYEDCRKMARESGMPLKDIMEEVKKAYVPGRRGKMR